MLPFQPLPGPGDFLPPERHPTARLLHDLAALNELQAIRAKLEDFADRYAGDARDMALDAADVLDKGMANLRHELGDWS